MPPKTRSRGVPAPSRVYHSTPAQQQAQFPPRRKVVRTYGKQTRKKETPGSARSMRQQTLTQIDFVSSFEEDHDPIVMDDSDEDHEDHDDHDEQKESEGSVDENKENKENKENRRLSKARDDGDEEPVSSGRKRRASSRKVATKDERAKRRRTLGEESDAEPTIKDEPTNRRRTLGDLPTSSYHTQTLTQFLGRDSAHALCIKDSEDEDDENDENAENDVGFQDWLQDPVSPTPRRHHQTTVTPRKQRQIRFASPKPSQPEASASNRQESVVPQTPAKRHRDEIPSSSQLSTPASIMMGRYGVPGHSPSPLKKKSSPGGGTTPRPILKSLPGKPRITTTPRRHERVIQDSFATDSWGSGGVMPLQERPIVSPGGETTASAESSSLPDEMDTPTKPRRRGESTELGDGKKAKVKAETTSPTPKKRASPRKAGKRVVLEIPDSDAEDEDFEVFDENDENVESVENDENDENDEGGFIAGPETQFIMNQIASPEEEEGDENAKPSTPTPRSAAAHVSRQNQATGASSTASSRSRPRPSNSSPQMPPIASSQPTTLPPPSSPPKPSRPLSDRLRKPLHDPSAHVATQTQPLESQRVPLANLQALPPPSARTDILLPLSPDMLSDVLEGFSVCLVLPFKIPAQVVRFWLFDGALLRFMACADAGRVEKGGGSWRYTLPQVYELNNPVDDDDMREEGWVDGEVDRYVYLPPAIIGQLLWNLRHALFSENDEDVGSMDAPSRPPSHTSSHDQYEEEEQVQLLPSSSAARPTDKIPAPTPTPSISVSQQVEAQIQSDIAQSTQVPTSDDILVPSTPEDEHHAPSSPTPTRASLQTAIKPPPSRLPPLGPYNASSYRASRPPINPRSSAGVRPSQATTASQASTPDKSSADVAAAASRQPSYPQLQSSSSVVFHDDSPLHMPHGFPLVAESSQLLTKSQMLPDSLIRDDALVPPEIWDSDEDGDGGL
ncbi:hypothetical protein G7Z17_g8920 [Cylindrodendrum hubeiense]|uniref:Uncharacterized protein n=1 Tax=Cylindrodendrum hubeiense TaxID=595255 RepID=A0A9P5H4Z2_9HYPO|nr:hypothetical protein G7Z17_g8920 [Cylindrodendrum hubeiense]